MPTDREQTLHEPNWECAECGHKMWAEFTGTVEFSVLLGCPGCGAMMDRLDPLGLIEKEARMGIRPLHLLAAVKEWPRIRGWING